MPTEPEIYCFLADDADEFARCIEVIRDNALELVAVELYATPKGSGAAAAALLVFGDSADRDAAA